MDNDFTGAVTRLAIELLYAAHDCPDPAHRTLLIALAQVVTAMVAD